MGGGDWLVLLVVAGGALAIIAALWRSASGGTADFEIWLGPGDLVEVRGRVPRSKVPGIRGFFRDQPGGVPRGRIRGRIGPGGAPKLEFRGRFEAAMRQRVRNFLVEHLR